MRLRLFVLTLLCAAVAAPTAPAGLQLQTVARDGAKTTSRGATGDCGFQNNYEKVNDLLLACTGSKGSATVRYDFYLPANLYGTPAMHVYAEKLCCTTSSIRKKLVKVTKRHYRIVVSVSKPTRLDVQSVSLSYYVKN
jgi:hypothetical protein